MLAGCSRSLTRVPLRRSSPLAASSSKTPKRQVRGVLTGMPMSTLLWAEETLHLSRSAGPAELEPAIYSPSKVLSCQGWRARSADDGGMISRALSESPPRRRLRISQAAVGEAPGIIEEVHHVPYIFHLYWRSSRAFARRGVVRTGGSTG